VTDRRLVHVIDDDDAVRESLDFLLETAGFAVKTYDSAIRFLEVLADAEPGCVLTDVRMPGMSGLELVSRLNAMGRAFPIIVMTGHADVPLAVEAMKAGVADFIEKPFEEETIIQALEHVFDRDSETKVLDPQRMMVLERMKSLSMREKQVLEGLVAGKANKIVAYDLGISPRTVEVYRANVMTKMQAGSLSELVRMALLAERTG
jgi:two-component system, LuxR family, response regulator FixJ